MSDQDRYRVGSKLGRTIYRDNELIGLMDTPELGGLVVEALNARDRFLAAERRPLSPEDQMVVEKLIGPGEQ